jgi:hypothetical protein
MTRREMLALVGFVAWFRRLWFRRTDPEAVPKRLGVFDRS